MSGYEKSSAVSSLGKIDASHIEEVSDEENEYYVGLFENMKDEQREIISTKIFEI